MVLLIKQKFVAFVDVVGFSSMVERSERGDGKALHELLEIVRQLGTEDDRARFQKHGPMLCPHSARIDRDLDFHVTQISDCVVVSSEVSPSGAVALVHHCSTAVLSLLWRGVMCRGYITLGKVFHTPSQVIGTAYQDAASREKTVSIFSRGEHDQGTPFVEISTQVHRYIEDCGDTCVKKMYGRMAIPVESGAAIFPFKQLHHSFVVAARGHKFDPDKETKSNDDLRTLLKTLTARIVDGVANADARAKAKADHYISALDAQLAQCDKTDEVISMLSRPFGR